jgi:hypothetical protein
MASIKLKVAGEGLIAKAHRLADVGATSGSSVIYEITDCPDDLTVEDLIASFKAYKPAAEEWWIPYGKLAG